MNLGGGIRAELGVGGEVGAELRAVERVERTDSRVASGRRELECRGIITVRDGLASCLPPLAPAPLDSPGAAAAVSCSEVEEEEQGEPGFSSRPLSHKGACWYHQQWRRR